jgi:membrane associated rhomboid family serine protease
MSDEQKPQPDQGPGATPARQPVFLLPWPVTALCGLLLAIEAASDFVLNDAGRSELLTWFAFIPYRLVDPTHYVGGWLPLIWTSVTHAFLHAGWEHVGLNVVWLAIFATPVTQRYGAVRMYILFLVGAVIGAWAFAAISHGVDEYLVGASGGIAALTGAAVRFIFQPPVVAVDPDTGERRLVGRHLATLRELAANPTARFFSLTWLVLNGIVPILPMFMGSDAVQVAWQAHIGGFLAGVLLVPLLERKEA